jgi:hypothetical protein
MKAKYLPVEPIPQMAGQAPRDLPSSTIGKAAGRVGLAGERAILGSPHPTHRQVLRAMRAAEMAAWEAAPPPTRSGRSQAAAALRQIVRAQIRGGPDHESLVICILAAAVLVTLLLALHDTSILLARWSQFVSGIRNLVS